MSSTAPAPGSPSKRSVSSASTADRHDGCSCRLARRRRTAQVLADRGTHSPRQPRPSPCALASRHRSSCSFPAGRASFLPQEPPDPVHTFARPHILCNPCRLDNSPHGLPPRLPVPWSRSRRCADRLHDRRDDVVHAVPLVVHGEGGLLPAGAALGDHHDGDVRVAGLRGGGSLARGDERVGASSTTTFACSCSITSRRSPRVDVVTSKPCRSSTKRISLTKRRSRLATTTRPADACVPVAPRAGAVSRSATDAHATWSPTSRPRRSHSPAASSTISRASRYVAVRQGRSSCTM